MTRILVVEDNADLAYGLRNNLEIEGYAVDVAADGTRGLTRARAARPDLIVLDLMLPGMDGFRVLRALRAEGLAMPVLILTARG
ncbi:MAG: response regulator, partial [Burkholderiales bacterium]